VEVEVTPEEGTEVEDKEEKSENKYKVEEEEGEEGEEKPEKEATPGEEEKTGFENFEDEDDEEVDTELTPGERLFLKKQSDADKLLGQFFEFLNTDVELNQTLSGYFMRIFEAFLRMKTRKVPFAYIVYMLLDAKLRV
jgi:hypothetical protein